LIQSLGNGATADIEDLHADVDACISEQAFSEWFDEACLRLEPFGLVPVSTQGIFPSCFRFFGHENSFSSSGSSLRRSAENVVAQAGSR